jgi:hypothetical protein
MALPTKPARKPAPDADAVRVVRERTREPRLPHDRDESADSQNKAAPDTRGIGRKAYEDVKAGRVDTDRRTRAPLAVERDAGNAGAQASPPLNAHPAGLALRRGRSSERRLGIGR